MKDPVNVNYFLGTGRKCRAEQYLSLIHYSTTETAFNVLLYTSIIYDNIQYMAYYTGYLLYANSVENVNIIENV